MFSGFKTYFLSFFYETPLYFVASTVHLFLIEKRLDDFVTNPISPSEKKTKLDVPNAEDKQEANTKLENNLRFTNIKKMEFYRENIEEIAFTDEGSMGLRVESEETNGVEMNIIETTEVEAVQVFEVSNEEVKVIETLEELESALEDVLGMPTNCPVISRVKTTVPFDLNLLVERTRAQRNIPKKVTEKRFLARINPGDAAVAEAELSRQISQSDFEKVCNRFISCIQENIVPFSFLDGGSWPV
jgi:hypothetical protein